MIKKNTLILFQGDSITDCGRSRNDDKQLGHGYASMVAARFNALYPELNVRFINKGISGDRTKDLVKRWRQDLDPKIHATRELAREFGAIFIPLDGIFAAAAVKQPPQFWAADGVHPTSAGHALIAHHWLNAIERL